MLRGLASLNGIDIRVSTPQTAMRGVILKAQPTDAPALPSPGDAPLVIEKGAEVVSGWLAQHSREAVLEAIDDGRVVIIPHNRSDIESLEALVGRPFGSRFLNNTSCKQEEARRIGQRQTLQAAEITRYAWDLPIGAQELIVLGAGLIGGGVTNAALDLGLEPSTLTVVDRDPAVRQRYAALGCKVFASIAEAQKVSRDRAVVISALPESAGDLDTLLGFSKDTIFVSMTGGSKGLEWRSNATDLYYQQAPDRYWTTGYDWEHHQSHYPDERFWQGGRKLRVVATGRPPNLLEEQWNQIFELTSSLVVGCALEGMTRPQNAQAIPEDLDREMIELYRKHGGDKIQPFKGYEEAEWKALLDDFKANKMPSPLNVGPTQRPKGLLLHDPRNGAGFGYAGIRQPLRETPSPAPIVPASGYRTIYIGRDGS
jgi:hypothetical protein